LDTGYEFAARVIVRISLSALRSPVFVRIHFVPFDGFLQKLTPRHILRYWKTIRLGCDP